LEEELCQWDHLILLYFLFHPHDVDDFVTKVSIV
jgi:hypothetical protein